MGVSAGSPGGGNREFGPEMEVVERQRNDVGCCRDCRRNPFQQPKGRIMGLEQAIMLMICF